MFHTKRLPHSAVVAGLLVACCAASDASSLGTIRFQPIRPVSARVIDAQRIPAIPAIASPLGPTLPNANADADLITVATTSDIIIVYGQAQRFAEVGLSSSYYSEIAEIPGSRPSAVYCFDVYGKLVPSWPKDAPTFFGAPGGVISQTNFQFDGITTNNPLNAFVLTAAERLNGQTHIVTAVSDSSNCNGKWRTFDYVPASGGDVVDLTGTGVTRDSIAQSYNVFDAKGKNFLGAETAVLDKVKLKAGTLTGNLFNGYSAYGNALDTVMPFTNTFGLSSAQDSILYEASTLNLNFNGCVPGCNQLTLFAIVKPLSANPTFSGVFVGVPNYLAPPRAMQKGGTTLFTGDARIGSNPYYNNGLLDVVYGTSVYNGSAKVPGLYYGQIVPNIVNNKLASAHVAFGAYISRPGNGAAFLAGLSPDARGDVFISYDVSDPMNYFGHGVSVHEAGDPSVLGNPYVVYGGHPNPGTGKNLYTAAVPSLTATQRNRVWTSTLFSKTDAEWKQLFWEALFM